MDSLFQIYFDEAVSRRLDLYTQNQQAGSTSEDFFAFMEGIGYIHKSENITIK